jgi:Cu/Ag efflux protein CusF
VKTLIRFSQILLVASMALLIGCSSAPKEEPEASGASGATGGSGATQAAIKQYPMHGKIVTVDAAAKKARIDGGAIGDWMGPMTMNYDIKDNSDLSKLAPGMEIDSTVDVQGDDFWLTDVKPAAK